MYDYDKILMYDSSIRFFTAFSTLSVTKSLYYSSFP